MSGIKIYPPNQLPAEKITDVQFDIWREELEIYLEQEKKFEKFMPGGRYEQWLAAEDNPQRIIQAKDPDKEYELTKIRKELRQFISLIGKYVHNDYYNPIIKHSTSLSWIYKKIRQDYAIETKGVHFLNVIDLKWDPTGDQTTIGFYNQYRSMIMSNLGTAGEKITWRNETLTTDEKLSPSHEDLILLNVLQIIHNKLPAYVKDQYAHKIGNNKRLMDFKLEILNKAKSYVQEIDSAQVAAAQCFAIQP